MHIADDPSRWVAEGTGRVLQELQFLRRAPAAPAQLILLVAFAMFCPACPAHDEQTFKRPYYIALAIAAPDDFVGAQPAAGRLRVSRPRSAAFFPLFGIAGITEQPPPARKTGDTAKIRNSSPPIKPCAVRNQNCACAARQHLANENERLRQLLGWQKQNRWNVKPPAASSLRDPANWWRTDRSISGVATDSSNSLPVLSPEGYLIGGVSSVSLTKSQVVLIVIQIPSPCAVENEAAIRGSSTVVARWTVRSST